MQQYKIPFHEWWMSMDQKPKGRKDKRFVKRRARMRMRKGISKEIREAVSE